MAESESNKWKEMLRKMLPAGAPLPDEEQLDYSIAVEYEGPQIQLDVAKVDPVDLDSLSIRRASDSSSRFPVLPPLSTRVSRFGKLRNVGKSRENLTNDESDSRRSSSVSARARLDYSDWGNGRVDEYSVSEVEIVPTRVVNAVTFDMKDNGVDEEMNPDGSPISVSRSRDKGRKSGVCCRCGKGNRLRERERCIVCDARYCCNCVLKAMGSMPEGRKCLGCIGQPIDETKRSSLGKCSRILSRVCSPLEVRQIMKAEKDCYVNQLRSEQVVINGRELRQEELAEILGCLHPPQKLRPGRYWYDKDSGLWGKEGEKPDRIVSSKLNIGGKLQQDASKGKTKVYINGREITKIELRVLKLAKVQCPRETHFWLYDDGSYEEEGQNNIRGNIWGKASTRFFSSLFSLPVPPELSRGANGDATTFSGRSVPDFMEQGRVQKLMLFGLEGSGTSTIFKQVRFLYGSKFTAEELQNLKLMIQSNLYRYLSILFEGREHFEEETLMGKSSKLDAEDLVQGELGQDGSELCVYSLNPRFKHFSDWLLNIMALGDLDNFFPAATREYAPVVDEIWRDPALQETYKRREELGFLPDAAKIFLDKAIEISSNEYEPSDKDILYAEGATPSNGLSHVEFVFDNHSPMSEIYNDNFECQPPLTKYQLIRVSTNCPNDSCKWLEMFEDTRAVVFCASLSAYDEEFGHSNGTTENKMLATKSLFKSIVHHPCFSDVPFVLLLNKYDLFEDKINRLPLNVCEWFTDFSPVKAHHNAQSLASQAYYYVGMKFKELYTSITGKKLYVWQTRALERESVNEAFKYVREVLKWEEEEEEYVCDVNGEDSFYSTEFSTSPYT